MIATSTKASMSEPTMIEPVDLFSQNVLASNPFERNRVNDPSQMNCDVESIHAASFNRLIELVEEAYREPAQGRGVLVLGSAGAGKSHLLARLAKWANRRNACFVYLHNIQVRPDDMSRYLLKCCITRLAEDRLDRLHETRLFQIVHTAVQKAADGQPLVLNESTVPAAYDALSHGGLKGDEEIIQTILRFYYHAAKAVTTTNEQNRPRYAAHAALAVRWLKGDLLDADEARSLGQLVRAGQESVELGEERIAAVLKTIALLARQSGQPLILCIDQADNMRREPLSELSKMLHALIDDTANLLVVVAGVRVDMLQHIQDNTITAAAADRLDHTRPIAVNSIRPMEALDLLRGRLHPFFDGMAKIPTSCHPFFQDDDLFPLGRKWFERIHGDVVELSPRYVLTSASDRWKEVQQRIREQGLAKWLNHWDEQPTVQPVLPPIDTAELAAVVDQKVDDKLTEAVTARRLEPGNLPADAGNLLGLTRQLLEQCLDWADKDYSLAAIPTPPKGIDLVVDERLPDKTVRNHVTIVVTGSKTSAAASLRRLVNTSGADHRILVTDESRSPLRLAAKGQDYYDELTRLGPQQFTHVKLTFEDYAELDALMSLLGEARSGDLEIEPRPGGVRAVTEAEVIESYHRHDRYRRHPLLKIFLSEDLPPAPPPPAFPPEEAFRGFVLGRLAFLMGANMIELAKSFAADHAALPGATELNAWLPNAKEIVLRMHNEELVSAQPWDNDLYLTIGRRA